MSPRTSSERTRTCLRGYRSTSVTSRLSSGAVAEADEPPRTSAGPDDAGSRGPGDHDGPARPNRTPPHRPRPAPPRTPRATCPAMAAGRTTRAAPTSRPAAPRSTASGRGGPTTARPATARSTTPGSRRRRAAPRRGPAGTASGPPPARSSSTPGPQQHQVVVPGDRRHQQPRRQHRPRCGAGGVDLPAPPAQYDQRAGEHGQAQHVPTADGSPSRTARPGSEALSAVSGTGSVRPIRSHCSPLAGPATSTPSSEAAAAAPNPAAAGRHRRSTSGSSSSGAERRLERHGDAVARGREQRVAAALGDPSGHQPDEQQPVDLPEQQRAVQRRRGEHHQHDGRGHPAVSRSSRATARTAPTTMSRVSTMKSR